MNKSLDAVRKNWLAQFKNRAPRDAAPKDAAPKQAVFRASASKPDTTEILLDDEIGDWGVTASAFKAQLSSVKTPNITCWINSPGGDVFDGFSIYNALRAHPANVTTIVDGLAASAASYIAMAGDKVIMAQHSFMMVHNAWGGVQGNKHDMRDMADTLDKIDGEILSVYVAKSGMSAEDCVKMMDGPVDGTWFTAQGAKDAGLIDAIDPDSEEEPDQKDPDEENEPDEKKNSISRMRMRLRIAEVA
jgi:ATP-dependent Clp endopeptidase proteolytic subunit ClpP